jgi:hypothetical protein
MKKQLLDPLGTMCKLVSLNFNKKNTKIGIHNHILSLQKPDKFQWLWRSWYGDGKENISEIYHVVIRIVRWFLVPELTSEDENSQAIVQSLELKKMVKYMCSALKKLQETYELGNVVLSLQFYINILECGLEGKFTDDMLPKYIIDKDKEYDNLLDYNKIKNLWDVKRLQRICELYDNCFKIYNEEDEGVQEDTRFALIDGYLRSIGAILDITDTEFQKLIQNSKRG